DDMVYYSRQAAVSSPYYSRCVPHAFDLAINSKAFDKRWGFSGWLGCRYHLDHTTFRLWAPTAERVELVLYHSTDDRASVSQVIPMQRGSDYNP
ncbi:type I pullulanase, partial [Psychrobacter sanguinis]|nr:type I pullulanase [Psychrobacter sanguinis]